MTSSPDAQQHPHDAAVQDEPEQYRGLDATSYTARRLHHASARHLYLTSRRHFIGPIPEHWIHSHRKAWYRSRLSFKNYTSRTLTFSAKTTSFNEAPRSPSPEPPTEVNETLDDRDDDGTPDDSTRRRDPSTHDPDNENQEVDTTEEGEPSPSDADTGVASTFVTARETLPGEEEPLSPSITKATTLNKPRASRDSGTASRWTHTHPSPGRSSQVLSTLHSATDTGSTASLLPHRNDVEADSTVSTKTLRPQEPQPHDVQTAKRASGPQDRVRAKIARFNLDDNVMNQQQRIRSRIERTQDKVSANRPRWSKESEGEMVRAQKMLVRVEETSQELPFDYSENISFRTETREIKKWREYVVVCRKALEDSAHFTLEMYKTRVIQGVEKSRKSAYYEVPLDKKITKVNLYSALDKTWAIWHPYKLGTRIFILRPRSSTHAMEWYTFIKQTLGWHRPTSLLINVPDLDISVTFKNPFKQIRLGNEVSRERETLTANAIVGNCINVLKSRSGWSEALEHWSKTSKMGLAWKRFDRLEWIYGANEEHMYETIGMQTSHDLELRPKHHYPTMLKTDGEEEVEPAPIEGFLVRLTSQKGVQQRLGKEFSKRQYYFSQDRFLCFCKPSKALPPHPPDTDYTETTIPTYQEIAERNPLRYDILPYPVQDGHITWLASGNAQFLRRRDEEAMSQFARNIANLQNAEGLVDLCQVNDVRISGDANGIRNSAEGQGAHDVDDSRFELVLSNDLVLRFKAYNEETRNEWIKRLTTLVRYWKNRVKADARELKTIRQHNLEILNIDERMESVFGQFASKWEVRRAEASPHLYNMCHLAGCRAIKFVARCQDTSTANLVVVQHFIAAKSFALLDSS
uniref:Meiotically up-regulated gene 56 protein n=1 Tax=Talaromyces marneffei PM1 TaxID=1077442 RepID=A0A093VRC4_TALMA